MTAMALVALVAATLSLLILFAPSLAEAQSRRAMPSTGRYVSDGGQAFVLDSSGVRPLLRFDESAEIWVLRPTPAPRGDIIYRNDNGDQILRVTADGGITLYTTRTPQGSPVSRSGTAQPLRTPNLGPVQLFNLMARRSNLVSEAVGRLITIDLDGSQSEALCVEALIVTTDAVIRMARNPSTRGAVNRLRKISIIEGGRASVSFSRGELRVMVDPSRGVVGRPSSAVVIRTMAGD
ncbi:DUF4908 domain-containing protein [Brevundimonas sp. UBA7534]|uniref:DUF4908 domain-containing protein n=1 Tax=Brevundimonas sp. UBA7534 TaxID=1946138 RepID=UPI0025C37DC3|nr:DUF4908 domain-containing protein [Brevundimonas sp. UBA7534]